MIEAGEQYREDRCSGWAICRPALCVLLCYACGSVAIPAQAETRAGDRVVNTASARYDAAAEQDVATSNTDVILVAERLDIALSRADMAASSAIPLVLTNRGNGMEAFRLSAPVAAGAARQIFAIDTDGDGRYDAARDTLIVAATTPPLDPGASLALLLLNDGDATGPVTVIAQAITGSGTPGMVFAGAGDGGGDAVVGPTGARAELTVPVTAQDVPPTLTKTQSVLAPDGSARAVRGAVISYTLVARFPTATRAARIDDPVPAGTSYVPGSLSLDGAAQADPGAAGAIAVALGDVPAAGVRTLQFKVRIQ